MRDKFTLVAIVIAFSLLALLVLAAQFIQPAPKKDITIATGAKQGQYYQYALKYKELLEEEKIKVTILNTSGSVENLKLLRANKIDVAFAQNGTIVADDNDSLRALASLYYEPLWVFYRRSIGNLQYIEDFQDKKIAVGAVGSGTRNLADEILAVNHIDSTNSEWFSYNTAKAKAALLKGDIDIAMMVISPKSQMVKDLLLDDTIALFSFNRAYAYSKKFVYLNPVTLYEGMVNFNPNKPEEDVAMLATTATLVANEDFHPELVRLLLKKAKVVHRSKSIFAEVGEFPNPANLEIALNKEADRYFQYGDSFLEQIFPFWIASNLDRLKILLIPLLTLLLPLIKSLLPVYRWSIRSKIYRWYKKVRAFDVAFNVSDKEQLLPLLEQLDALQREIQAETKVPLSYMGEYYNLLMHLELIESKIKVKLNLPN